MFVLRVLTLIEDNWSHEGIVEQRQSSSGKTSSGWRIERNLRVVRTEEVLRRSLERLSVSTQEGCLKYHRLSVYKQRTLNDSRTVSLS